MLALQQMIFFFSFLPLDAIWAFDNNQLTVIGKNATAGIFATYPSEHLNVVNGFFDQVRGCWEDENVFEEESFGWVWATCLVRKLIAI